MLATIATGVSATVKKVLWQHTEVAVKKLKVQLSGKKTAEGFKREVGIFIIVDWLWLGLHVVFIVNCMF